MGQEVIIKAAAVVGLITSIGGGYAWFDAKLDEMDKKHVHVTDYQDFQWSMFKKQLRDLRADMEKERKETGQVSPGLVIDYQELLDLFCRKYEDDRECK